MSANNKPILFRYFSDTADILLAEHKRSSQQMASANIGKNREVFCINFLSKVLPPKLHVKSGEIWDSKNIKTGQLEVIITREDAPALHVGSEDIYLAEGVFAVIEVKSNLDRSKLAEAGRGLEKVRNLTISASASISIGKPLKSPLRIVFAYEGASWETLIDEISKNQWEELFDLVCILDRGILIKKGGLLDWSGDNKFSVVNGKAASLAFLYYYLAGYGTSFLGRSLNLSQYFEPLNSWNE